MAMILVCLIIMGRIYFEQNKALTLPLCMLLGDFGDPVARKITTGIISIVLLSSMIMALKFYISLLRYVNTSMKAFNAVTEEIMKRRSGFLTFNVALVYFTNIICWLPTGLFYFISLFLQRFPLMVQYLITFIILPINPLLNPILFNLSDIKLSIRRISVKPLHKDPAANFHI